MSRGYLSQKLLARLWWGPARRPFEALVRRLPGARRRILAGPLRGFVFRGGLSQHLGIYELPVQNEIRGLLGPGEVFYDVGGHWGYFSLLAAATTGPSGQVQVFEPLPENFQAIRQAARANHIGHLQVFPWAIAETSGEAELFWQDGQKATALPSLVPEEGARHLRVTTKSLDELIGDHPPPDLLKVDVEGAEDQVLAGASALLAARRSRWIIEVHSPEKEHLTSEILSRGGYRIRPLRRMRTAAYPRHIVAEPT